MFSSIIATATAGRFGVRSPLELNSGTRSVPATWAGFCTQSQVGILGGTLIFRGAGQSFDVRVAGQRGRICHTPESGRVPRPADTA